MPAPRAPRASWPNQGAQRPPADPRLVIAFQQPPRPLGFTAARFGRTWWKLTPSLEAALALARHLQSLDIHGRIKKPTAKPRQPAPGRPRNHP